MIQKAKNSLPDDDVGGHSALQYVIIGRQRVRLWQWVCNGPGQTLLGYYIAVMDVGVKSAGVQFHCLQSPVNYLLTTT